MNHPITILMIMGEWRSIFIYEDLISYSYYRRYILLTIIAALTKLSHLAIAKLVITTHGGLVGYCKLASL